MLYRLLVLALGLGYSLFLFIHALAFPDSYQPGVPSAAFFPYIVAALLALLSAGAVVTTFVKRRNGTKTGGDQPEGADIGNGVQERESTSGPFPAVSKEPGERETDPAVKAVVETQTQTGTQKRWWELLAIVMLMLCYCLLWIFDLGNFLLNSMAIFLPIALLYSKERVWWKTLLFVTTLVVFMFVLFRYLLRVPL